MHSEGAWENPLSGYIASEAGGIWISRGIVPLASAGAELPCPAGRGTTRRFLNTSFSVTLVSLNTCPGGAYKKHSPDLIVLLLLAVT